MRKLPAIVFCVLAVLSARSEDVVLGYVQDIVWADVGGSNFVASWSSAALSIPSNQVAHWKLNDSAASTVVIDSLGSYNGVASRNTSLMSTNGKLSTAFHIRKPSRDRVDIPHSDALDSTGSVTVCAWVYPQFNNSIYDNNYQIAEKTPHDSGWELVLSTDYVYIRGGGATALFDRSYRTTNRWDFIAMSISGTMGKIYVNGVLTTNGTVNALYHTGGYVIIGGTDSYYNYHFNGSIDDLRIFSRALSDSEIADMYNAGNGTESY